MNEKIVILGNGFDLRHFLPTKYDHLITILREIESLDFSTFDEIKFDDLFGNLFKERDEWFYEKICDYYNTNEIIFNKDSLQSIKYRLKENSWFNYLKSVEDSKIETWIDFEVEIERVLKSILEFFALYNDSDNTKKEIIKDGPKDDYVFYIDSTRIKKIFKNEIQSNIALNFGLFQVDQSQNLIADEKFLIVVNNELQYFKEKEFYNSMYQSLENFIGIFNDYIEKIVNVFYKNFKEEKKESFIIQKNKFLFSKVNKIYSFNYTNSYENFYWNISEAVFDNYEFKVDFVHGSIINDWNNELDKLKVVLGVSDISDNLKNHKLFQFTKYFQKLHKNTDYLFLDKILKSFSTLTKNGNGYTIYFWGHSLDSSDSEYIKDVFKVLSKSDSEIKIFYHSISGKADQLKNLLNIIDKDTIEDLMKNKRLIFIESTPDNLFAELS